MADCECVIIGGGIAGLTSAYHLRGRDVLLLEESDRLGGRVRSESRGDYWVNLGAQFVAPQGPLAELAALPGVRLNNVVGDPRIEVDGRLVKASATSLMLKSGLPVSSRATLARFGIQLEVDFRRSEGKSDRARSYRRALDERRASELFPVTEGTRPLMEALARSWMSTELSDVSGAHATSFFHHGMASGKGMRELTFPTHGSETVVQAVARELSDATRILTGTRVREVRPVPTGVEVEYEHAGGSSQVTAQTCIVAVPAYAARQIVQGLPDDYLGALSSVQVGSFVVVGLFTNETGPQPWDGVPMVTAPGRAFHTLFNPVSAVRGGERRPGGSLSLYAGGDMALQLMEASDDEVAAAAVRDACSIIPLRPEWVEEVVVQRWPRAMPFWAPGGCARMRELRQPFSRIGFAGDYLGLPGMPSASAAGKLAADAARAELAA